MRPSCEFLVFVDGGAWNVEAAGAGGLPLCRTAVWRRVVTPARTWAGVTTQAHRLQVRGDRVEQAGDVGPKQRHRRQHDKRDERHQERVLHQRLTLLPPESIE